MLRSFVMSYFLQSELKVYRWQKLLYQKIDRTIAMTGCHEALGVSTKEEIIIRIMTLAKVMHALYLVSVSCAYLNLAPYTSFSNRNYR